MAACGAPGCDRPERTAGLCGGHYARRWKHGPSADLTAPVRERIEPRPACSVVGCNRPRRSRGLCPKHYQRKRQYGRTDRVVAPRGAGFITASGYHARRIDGRQKLTHREVMEKKLGRPLRPDENVHHINGDRLDNRPKNLEVWSTSQPCGQRIEDKVAWASDLLARYEPEWIGGGC